MIYQGGEQYLELKKNQIYRVCLTILSVIITIIIPIVNYSNFKNSVNMINCPTCPNSTVSQIDLGALEATYDILIYFFVGIGIIIAICAYSVFKFQKYSIKRALLLLLISIMYVLYVAASSQMSIIFIEVSKIQIIMNFSNVYILFIIITSLYLIKNLYDLVDYKLNQSYYSSILTDKKIAKFKQKKAARSKLKQSRQKLIKCPKCKYSCRPEWKKCPICKTRL